MLDLYAGTGALGIEALSRGAVHATLVESAHAALSAMRANIAELGLAPQTRVLAGSVGLLAPRIARDDPYDIVFADPPWRSIDLGEAPLAIAAVVERGALAHGGLLVLEHSSRSPPPVIERLELLHQRCIGDATVAFYRLTESLPLSGQRP